MSYLADLTYRLPPHTLVAARQFLELLMQQPEETTSVNLELRVSSNGCLVLRPEDDTDAENT